MPSSENPNIILKGQTVFPSEPISFSDLPDDILICILSFLIPSDVTIFACVSRRHARLCNSDSILWYAMCDRRWGSVTAVRKWGGGGKIAYRLLYATLDEWDTLIGFWRQIGTSDVIFSPLVLFEWGPSFIAASRICPSQSGTYEVTKAPFLWMGLSPHGEVVNLLHPNCRIDLSADFSLQLGFFNDDLVPVNINFTSNSHVVVEENQFFFPRKIEFASSHRTKEDFSVVEDVMEDRYKSSEKMDFVAEIYQYLANRTSSGGDKRHRRREKEMQWRRKWEPGHFVKIVNHLPTSSRPLQGLWKGICDEKGLIFFLVVYDNNGGISCQRVGDSLELFSGHSPVFWISNTTFIDSPFSHDVKDCMHRRHMHLHPLETTSCIHGDSLSGLYKDLQNQTLDS